MGQFTPAQVTFSPRLSTMSLPRALYGPWNEVPFSTRFRRLYRKSASLADSGTYAAHAALAAAKARSIRDPSILRQWQRNPVRSWVQNERLGTEHVYIVREAPLSYLPDLPNFIRLYLASCPYLMIPTRFNRAVGRMLSECLALIYFQ